MDSKVQKLDNFFFNLNSVQKNTYSHYRKHWTVEKLYTKKQIAFFGMKQIQFQVVVVTCSLSEHYVHLKEKKQSGVTV